MSMSVTTSTLTARQYDPTSWERETGPYDRTLSNVRSCGRVPGVTSTRPSKRDELLRIAVDRASVDGLEGLTIGRLASDAGMSKSGVAGLFGSKADLQVATVRAAAERFERDVV